MKYNIFYEWYDIFSNNLGDPIGNKQYSLLLWVIPGNILCTWFDIYRDWETPQSFNIEILMYLS